ncbi:MAG: hypothetical protein HYY86_02495 [Candidatus Harrisonbacteria bacterium]|nr:hypothetical protein [Candidatus Harrisonbacteria bacterium]
MGRNRRGYIMVSLAMALLFFNGLAEAAYEVKVNLNTLGGGTGRVIFSATSSRDFEFSGWSGESCIGKGLCVLGDLIPKSSKIVIASFNAPLCTEFTYSDFGACQLDGTARRTVTSAGPLGCVGGDPVTSRGCFYDPCARAQTTEVTEPSLWERFKDMVGSVQQGDYKEALDKAVDLVTGGGKKEPLLEIPSSFPPGGGAGGPSQYEVDVSDTTVIPVSGPKPEPLYELPDIIITAPRYVEPKPETELPDIIITAPRDKPGFDFQFDTSFTADPGVRCK